MLWANQLFVLGRILLAMVLGGVIGFEREAADKPAGLRTHMLIGGASALLVALGNFVVTSFGQNIPVGNLRADPIRVIEAIIVGISFVGAGTIIRRERSDDVEGLTTAASVLFTTGVGIATALSLYVLAITSVLLILAINWVLGFIEGRLFKN
jgi:putative Mg2+ transporter-C (MgtC) family protein